MAKDLLQWSEDTRQKCQEAVLRLKAGMPAEEVAAKLKLPEKALVKQMLIVYRATAKLPVADLLQELRLQESDIAALKEAYFRVRGEVLWERKMGPLSAEEKRYLDFMSQLAGSNTQPEPKEMVGKFGMSGTLAFGQFMKKMTEIITTEQHRLLDELSTEGDPRLAENIEKTRAHVSAVHQSIQTGDKNATGHSAQRVFAFSEPLHKHCHEIGVWMGIGIATERICENFGVPAAEIKQIALVAKDGAGKPVDLLCDELNLDPEQIPQLRRELLLLRHESLLSTKGGVSERERFYLERVVNESLSIRGAANLFTMSDPSDKEYETFERSLVQLNLTESLRVLSELKTTASDTVLDKINIHEANMGAQLERFTMLCAQAGTSDDSKQDELNKRRRESNLEVATALKDVHEAKGPLDKMKQIKTLFKATKKAEKIEDD